MPRIFEDVFSEMTDEEIDISRSTPSFRFDVVAECAEEDDASATPATDAARDFVAK